MSISKKVSPRRRRAARLVWKRTTDRAARTANARRTFMARFGSAEERSRYFASLTAIRERKKAAARKGAAAMQEASASGRPAA